MGFTEMDGTASTIHVKLYGLDGSTPTVSTGSYQGPITAEIWGITPDESVLRRKISA